MGPMSVSTIKDGQTILLDTMVPIYFLEAHERYGSVAEDILRRIERGKLRGIISSLVFVELLVPLYREEKAKAAAGLVPRLASFSNLSVHHLDAETASLAARLRAEHGLRTPDAIHAATAIMAGANGILTNDRQLCRLESEGLKIWLFEDLSH